MFKMRPEGQDEIALGASHAAERMSYRAERLRARPGARLRTSRSLLARIALMLDTAIAVGREQSYR